MRTIVALVTGGFTGEIVIALQSAEGIHQNLDTSKFEVYSIVITKDSWYHEDTQGHKHTIDRNDFSLTLQGKKILFDIAFIAIHGSPGEDGKLQGYFDMLQIPYTGCDMLTSALTMNKGYTKAIVANIENLHIAISKQFFSDKPENIDAINQTLRLPLFIKPNNGGSSIGMSKVKTKEELPQAMHKAFQEDTQVLVEEFIKGREYTIGVYQNKNGLQTLPLTEIVTTKEFFDFEAKYIPGMADEITPGRIEANNLQKLQKIAKEVYRHLNCQGVVRLDFILEESTDKFYFIELNSIPGQTKNSLIPKQVKATGMTLQHFYTEIIEGVLHRATPLKRQQK